MEMTPACAMGSLPRGRPAQKLKIVLIQWISLVGSVTEAALIALFWLAQSPKCCNHIDRVLVREPSAIAQSGRTLQVRLEGDAYLVKDGASNRC